MGVLTYRVHVPISAIAAAALVSTSAELPDKPSLRSLANFTGQTILLSSQYAPSASSSFEVDFIGSNPPPMGPTNLLQPAILSHVVRTTPPVGNPRQGAYISSFASQSSAVRFHKARPAIPPSLSPGWAPQLEFYPLGLLPPVAKSSPLLVLNELSTQSDASLPPSALRTVHSTSLKYPAMPHSWYARISPQRSLTTELPFRFPRFSQTYNFEKLMSSLHGMQPSSPMASMALLHMWHGPWDSPTPDDGEKPLVKQKPSVAVVLLGWLGAEHKHLKKYVDWYTSRGIHAVTFIVPMRDLLSLRAGDRAEEHVDVLTQNLVQWLKEDASQGNEKIVIFHTFSNTGWLTYGAVLERLISQGDDYLDRIKGCVVDSAPSARPDPQVWASGFSAALLKKNSAATQLLQGGCADGWNGRIAYPKPSFRETALLAMLEQFFSIFLQIPHVNRRLSDVVSVLANQQPSCPQLYIYSSADAVIPSKSVESFIEEQKKAGHTVSACNFQCSPHVDHFRTYPDKYSEQLTSFLKVCVPQWAIQ